MMNYSKIISFDRNQPNCSNFHFVFLSLGAHCFSTGGESTRGGDSSPTQSAYELLGVSETSSFAEIKASFRKLAKLTHPDLANSRPDSADSQPAPQFVQILAAYEILSDSEKRALYDAHLLSQRKKVIVERKKFSYGGGTLRAYEYRVSNFEHMEVVEWLKWYRFAIKEILSEKRLVVGDGYFDVLERDFCSALHHAYYGPEIESMDFLPDRFEAEERSVRETPEVLHLVSGRELFGMVSVVKKFPELTFRENVKLKSLTSSDPNLSMKFDEHDDCNLRAYADLELCIYGQPVAVATRVPPKGDCYGTKHRENEDHIRVSMYSYGNGCSDRISRGVAKENYFSSDTGRSRIPLGVITGLGTSSDEDTCFVYDSSGTKTHVIMKYRTLLVKHMQWYRLVGEVSVCECRCSRAKLPPSKFWLFEPRCGLHDIGGWYIEMFGRDKKGKTVPSQRYWDGFDPNENSEKRLHPAMYLLALAYRTLDLEDARMRKQTVVQHVERKLSRILNWCKKLV